MLILHRSILIFCLLLTGCAPYRSATCNFCAANHSLYRYIPRHRSQIASFDLPRWIAWAIAGNDDDGIFGECCSPPFRCNEPPSGNKALRWFLRNPLHNFTFYVIGSANRVNSELTLLEVTAHSFCIGRYRPGPGVNFPSRCGGLFIALHGWKPFISLRLRHCPHRTSDFYIGWRERGNFGAKINFFTNSCRGP